MLEQERKEAVLALQRTTDPTMDQELFATRFGLNMLVEGMIFEMGRLSSMDGSDCDDEDQHSGDYASGKRINHKLRPIPTVSLI